MAVVIKTSSPKGLLTDIKKLIDDGKVSNWTCDEDGDFTRTDQTYRRKAWLRPIVSEGQLLFKVFPPANSVMSSEVYAVYHARFVEMILRHCDSKFSEVHATALPRYGDRVDTRSDVKSTG